MSTDEQRAFEAAIDISAIRETVNNTVDNHISEGELNDDPEEYFMDLVTMGDDTFGAQRAVAKMMAANYEDAREESQDEINRAKVENGDMIECAGCGAVCDLDEGEADYEGTGEDFCNACIDEPTMMLSQ